MIKKNCGHFPLNFYSHAEQKLDIEDKNKFWYQNNFHFSPGWL